MADWLEIQDSVLCGFNSAINAGATELMTRTDPTDVMRFGNSNLLFVKNMQTAAGQNIEIRFNNSDSDKIVLGIGETYVLDPSVYVKYFGTIGIKNIGAAQAAANSIFYRIAKAIQR